MRIVAFDLSLRATGWAEIHDGLISWGVLESKLRDLPRMDWLYQQISERARLADLVVMEDFAPASHGRGQHEIGGLHYLVRRYVWKAGIPWAIISPNQVKKFVCGSGGSPKNPVLKEHILREVYKRWGHEPQDNNEADAIGLLYIGRGLVGEWQPTTKPQMEVLAEVRRRNAAELEKVSAAA